MQHYITGFVLVSLDPQDARPLYLQIMDEVKRALAIGTLKPEEPMPSVRELAAELVVNPRTVSQAYHELEREGLIYVRRGHGTFVSPNAQPTRDQRREMREAVAQRALLDARRNGVRVADLIKTIRELATEDEK